MTGKEAWSTPEFPPGTGGVQLTGGALATAGGLVFLGNLPNHEFSAYRATNGEELWKYDIKTGVFNGAITYELDGEQYVALAVGGSAEGRVLYAENGARMLAFKLGGTAKIPDIPPYQQPDFVQVPQTASAEVIAHGSEVFSSNCAMCHGQGAKRPSSLPGSAALAVDRESGCVRFRRSRGRTQLAGMVSFASRLKPADTEAVRAYLISAAEASRNALPSGTPLPLPQIHAEDSDSRAGSASSRRKSQ